MITLDGTIYSNLHWDHAIDQAKDIVDKGDQVLWNLDLGVTSDLHQPISNPMLFNAMKLSLDHFIKNVWEQFQDKTLGLIIYRGEFELDDRLLPESNAKINDPLEKRLLSRDIILNYFRDLTLNLPDKLTIFFVVDRHAISDPFERALLLNRSCFDGFSLLNSDYQKINYDFTSEIGILLANDYNIARQMQKTFERLTEEGIPFRLIPEDYLSYEWEGLSMLYVPKNGLAQENARKVLGFQAAGGKIFDYS